MEMLESVRAELRSWRGSHRRGRLPDELRRRVGAVAAKLGDAEVGARLSMEPGSVQRCRELYQGSVEAELGGFIEVGAAPARRRELRVEISSASGVFASVEGALEIEEVARLLAAMVGGEG